MTDINKIKSLIKAIDNDFINSRRKSNLTTLIPIKYLNDMYYECILNNKLDKNYKLIYFFSKCFN